HRGGWRDEIHLRSGKPAGGRLWQRTNPTDLGLPFSRNVLRFLIWATSSRLGDRQDQVSEFAEGLPLGDLLFLFFAHEGFRGLPESADAAKLRSKAPFLGHGLCWLMYPEDFQDVSAQAVPDFAPWMESRGTAILEALQKDLEKRWIDMESGKERMANPTQMMALGQSQERVLQAFMTSCEKAQRRDLARFILRAASRLLGPEAHAGMWTGALNLTGQRLADRTSIYQGATSFLRQLTRLAEWARWARGVWRFDEEYPAAQLWLEDWEKLQGDAVLARAQAIVRNLDPMRQAAAAPTN
ncbi:MAG: hypothetical protein ACKO23_21725, partial [Gemmataceae bacterium]